ncbi:uncharacterized protein LOC100877901 isoform X4 [Megachile rotundata]|uniref:uncharacterized protein LOC100877901 isoform X4 n=1 Tax=Megachile rotundata TaxID=143995 RepID=UPI003FD3D95F
MVYVESSIPERRHYQAIAVSDRLCRVRNFHRLFNVNITFVENLEFILTYISSKLSFTVSVQFIAGRHSVIFLILPRSAITKKSLHELDSFMFQTVGYQGVEYIAEAIGLPMYREPTFGRSKMQEKYYYPTENDEVEDLFRLLSKVKEKENIEAVSSGAILSDYQRIRVENVCGRLGLVSLSYLWRREQDELLKEMIESSVNAVLIKVAALGLEPRHLGKPISEMQSHLAKIKEKYGVNMCGEGGEYETFTLDCPLFNKSIVIDEYESVIHSNDNIAPVGYLNFKKIHVQEKSDAVEGSTLQERLKNVPIKTPSDYIAEIIGPELHDGCNLSEDENDEHDCTDSSLKTSNSGQFNPPSPMQILYEEEDYPDVPVVNRNQTGWFWFGGIAGKHPDAKSAMREALEKLSSLVKKENLQISDIVAVTLYIKDMSNYISINEAYISCLNKPNPPVRVCVECPLNIHVVLDAIAYKETQDCGDKKVHKRHTMHVQSISHWAPANIGPYSQAVRVGDIISVAGQIPLVPGSMTILELNIKRQCRLTLRHIDRIVKAMDSNTQLRDIVQDEETGKCVGNFKVAIRRRWNYENNVSAIVCYMSTGSSNSTGNLATETSLPSAELTVSELTEAFEYVLCKLTKGSQTINPTCNLRIFYKVGSSPGPKFVQDVLSKFSTRNLVTTIIPATHLHNFSTFLSICGIRHE